MGDFDCYFERKSSDQTVSQKGTQFYISPDQRKCQLGRVSDYNPFKVDVFALGMTVFVAASLDPPFNSTPLWPLENFDQETKGKVQSLSYSADLQNLLIQLLSEQEQNRPDMQEVLQIAYAQLSRICREVSLEAKAAADYAKAQKTLQELIVLASPGLPDPHSPADNLHDLQLPAGLTDEECSPHLQNMDAESPLELTVRCGLSYVRVSSVRVDEVPCMISLQARKQDSSVRTYTIDLMCVVDLSGSMDPALMPLVKSSLTSLLDKLEDIDRLCIVEFNCTAARKCPFIRCSGKGKEHIQTIIDSLTCGGNTNIAQGFLMGLDLLKRRQNTHQAAHLWLISGSPNNCGSNATVSCLEALRQCGLSQFSVSTFGYGPELEFTLLKDLAKEGKGRFYHVTQQEQIPDIFTKSISYATTVVARDIHVNLTPLSKGMPCEITRIYATVGDTGIKLHDIHVNDRKELVFLLKPLYIDLTRPISCPVLDVSLNYIDNEGMETWTRSGPTQ